MNFSRRRWKLFGALLLIVLAIASMLFKQRPAAASQSPVTILSEPYAIPVTPRDRLAMTFPNNRFVSRLENAFFGPRKPLNIKTTVFSLSADQSHAFHQSLPLGDPTFTNSTGLQIWIPDRATIERSSRAVTAFPQIDFLAAPRIMTAEGIASSIFMGQSIPLNGLTNSVGFSLECVAEVREHLVDLVTTISDSELRTNILTTSTSEQTNSVSIQTNLNLRARLQIPKGHGVLIIQTPANNSDAKVLGVMIDPPQ